LKLVCNVKTVYRNLKTVNSQYCAQKPHRNRTFINSPSVLFCTYSYMLHVIPESIARHIEDQAFMLSYDMAPPPPPSPVRQYKLDRRHIGRLRKGDNLRKGEGRRGRGNFLFNLGLNSYSLAWSSSPSSASWTN
jgi:hypothetical protein